MTTNLLCAVVITIVTNVVPSDNARWERDWGMSWPEGGGPMRIAAPATESYLTTNVTEHSVITVPLPGGAKEFSSDRLISSVTAILKKLEEWKPAGMRTNDVVPKSTLWTNTTIRELKISW